MMQEVNVKVKEVILLQYLTKNSRNALQVTFLADIAFYRVGIKLKICSVDMPSWAMHGYDKGQGGWPSSKFHSLALKDCILMRSSCRGSGWPA